MKRAVSLITETAAWLTSLSGALAQKYICTKTNIQLHKDKNTTGQRQKYNYTQKIQLHKDKNTTTQRKNESTPFPKLSLENINRPSITFFQCLFSNEEFWMTVCKLPKKFWVFVSQIHISCHYVASILNWVSNSCTRFSFFHEFFGAKKLQN